MVLNLDTLSFHCFSTGNKGNLYTLIMQRKDMNFPTALKWAADFAGLDKEEYDIDLWDEKKIKNFQLLRI